MIICDFDVIYSLGLFGAATVENPSECIERDTFFEKSFLVENSDCVDKEENSFKKCSYH